MGAGGCSKAPTFLLFYASVAGWGVNEGVEALVGTKPGPLTMDGERSIVRLQDDDDGIREMRLTAVMMMAVVVVVGLDER